MHSISLYSLKKKTKYYHRCVHLFGHTSQSTLLLITYLNRRWTFMVLTDDASIRRRHYLILIFVYLTHFQFIFSTDYNERNHINLWNSFEFTLENEYNNEHWILDELWRYALLKIFTLKQTWLKYTYTDNFTKDLFLL